MIVPFGHSLLGKWAADPQTEMGAPLFSGSSPKWMLLFLPASHTKSENATPKVVEDRWRWSTWLFHNLPGPFISPEGRLWADEIHSHRSDTQRFLTRSPNNQPTAWFQPWKRIRERISPIPRYVYIPVREPSRAARRGLGASLRSPAKQPDMAGARASGPQAWLGRGLGVACCGTSRGFGPSFYDTEGIP